VKLPLSWVKPGSGLSLPWLAWHPLGSNLVGALVVQYPKGPLMHSLEAVWAV